MSSSPEVQLLPPNQRCVRLQAETPRCIIQTLQTQSQQTLIPKVAEKNCRSLLVLGFGVKHGSGMACRPILPNAVETIQPLEELYSGIRL